MIRQVVAVLPGPPAVARARYPVQHGQQHLGSHCPYAYTFLAWPFPTDDRRNIFMGGTNDAVLREPARWPMLSEEPQGFGFAGSLADPPASAVPHSGGMNVAYGDGHARFHRMDTAEGHSYILYYAGDGVQPGQ